MASSLSDSHSAATVIRIATALIALSTQATFGCQRPKQDSLSVTVWVGQELHEAKDLPWPRFSDGDHSDFFFIEKPKSVHVRIRDGVEVKLQANSLMLQQKEGKICRISASLRNQTNDVRGCGNALSEAVSLLNLKQDSPVSRFVNEDLTCKGTPTRYYASEAVGDRVKLEVSATLSIFKTWDCTLEVRKVSGSSD